LHSLVEMGTAVAIYRTDAAAMKAARETLRHYQQRRFDWYGKTNDESREYIERNYRADIKRLVVYPAKLGVSMNEGEDVL